MLSIDPSSPFTRGALLGDRIRLSDHFLDPGVFIRSMASRGALGGLSEATLQAALLMDASGKDDVFIETVGVGQAEIDIVDHADTIVLVLMPGSGDSIQALKAGRDGDPRRHRRQQGRPPDDRHDDPRDPGRPLARSSDLVAEGPDRQDRGRQGRGRGGARREDRPSTASTSRRRARWRSAGARNLRNEVLELAAARMRRRARGARSADDASVRELLDASSSDDLDPASAAKELARARATAD